MGVARRDEANLCVVGGNGVKVDLELWGLPFLCWSVVWTKFVVFATEKLFNIMNTAYIGIEIA